MGVIKTIKNSIKTKLEGLQYGDETAFAEVVSDTRISFDKYPAAAVIMNGQPNRVSTNKQNERTVEFLIICYIQYEALPANESAAFDLAYDFNDLVVDALDDLTVAGVTLITEPTQSGWEIYESAAGNVLGIMATVRIRYSHDIVNGI